MLQTLLNTPKIIRHIQRGNATWYGYNPYNISLAGFTNLDKMIFLVFGGPDRLSTEYNSLVIDLTLTTLSITSSGAGIESAKYSYQVIEFA